MALDRAGAGHAGESRLRCGRVCRWRPIAKPILVAKPRAKPIAEPMKPSQELSLQLMPWLLGCKARPGAIRRSQALSSSLVSDSSTYCTFCSGTSNHRRRPDAHSINTQNLSHLQHAWLMCSYYTGACLLAPRMPMWQDAVAAKTNASRGLAARASRQFCDTKTSGSART